LRAVETAGEKVGLPECARHPGNERGRRVAAFEQRRRLFEIDQGLRAVAERLVGLGAPRERFGQTRRLPALPLRLDRCSCPPGCRFPRIVVECGEPCARQSGEERGEA
jgi:hypothetical protein